VRVRTFSVALFALALLVPEGAAADTTRIIVKREPGLSRAEREDIRDDAGVRLVRSLELQDTELVTATNPDRALDRLDRDRDVEYAELDRRREALADPGLPFLWGLANSGQALFPGEPDPETGLDDADIDGVEAWGSATGMDQKVAVVDSGAQVGHPDLAGQFIDDGLNFVQHEPHITEAPDLDGHGTHVAGTIAAIRGNDQGVAGVAPDAQLMALRALDKDGEGFDSDIADAFDHAGDANVRVVNASLGGPGASQTLHNAIAAHPNTLFVVAAGNQGRDNDLTPSYPCNVPLPNVMCVGASTNRDLRASFSNYGDQSVHVFAPGEYILSTIPLNTVEDFEDDQYLYMSGTSMATPHVAGIAALVLQMKPLLTAEQLKEIILASADPKPAFAGISVSGRRANAAAAVQYALTGTLPPDRDSDGYADPADACPDTAAPNTLNGCPADPDGDRVGVGDNCPTTSNPGQGDSDLDGTGDACDATPRGPDADGDGKPALDDACPTMYGTGSNGCPVVTPKPPPPPLPPDPKPEFMSLSKSVKDCGRRRRCKRAVTLKLRTDRPANVDVALQRRKCNKRGRRCRWTRVARRTVTASNATARIKIGRLRKGSYRAVVQVSNATGTSKRTVRFRVR
jgi:subtilisin family serine protease